MSEQVTGLRLAFGFRDARDLQEKFDIGGDDPTGCYAS